MLFYPILLQQIERIAFAISSEMLLEGCIYGLRYRKSCHEIFQIIYTNIVTLIIAYFCISISSHIHSCQSLLNVLKT